MQNCWLAIEGGGSKTRVVLADADTGAVLARETGGPANVMYIEPKAHARQLAQLLQTVREAAQGSGARVVAAGLVGPMAREIVEQAVMDCFGVIPIVHAGEGDIGLALYGLSSGVTLVAGTGSSCSCIDEHGGQVCCGGYGPQVGDEGSGFWIGREGIAAAARAFDGYGPRTVLWGKLKAYLDIDEPHEMVRQYTANGHLYTPTVAGFTPHLFDTARGGDVEALRICKDAGVALAALAAAVLRRSNLKARPAPIVPTGGVFHGGTLILAPLEEALKQQGVEYTLYAPAPEPIEGLLKIMRMKLEGLV
ncbi:MAG: hypothetical protein KJ052_08195 [Candidatus Hydrogenedentes bacterium]|nr:hypothetical protein [Candidatus Hydrogenedentota bacterium]